MIVHLVRAKNDYPICLDGERHIPAAMPETDLLDHDTICERCYGIVLQKWGPRASNKIVCEGAVKLLDGQPELPCLRDKYHSGKHRNNKVVTVAGRKVTTISVEWE